MTTGIFGIVDAMFAVAATARMQGRTPQRWVLGWQAWQELRRHVGFPTPDEPSPDLKVIGLPAVVEETGAGFGLVVR